MSRHARIGLLGVFLTGFALAVAAEFPLCPMASTFGIPCPGCGLTRATLALARGQLHEALHLHPLVWLLTPLFVGAMTGVALDLVRDAERPPQRPLWRWSSRATTVAGCVVFVLTLSVWLARFAGYFGGPVPVVSLRDWLAR